jgi:O-antigen/teichoic acid export membrane protein
MLLEDPSMTDKWRIGIARNISWLTGASILVKPLWLVFVVFLCWRYLGTRGFGIFSTALWLAFIPAALTDLGLTQLTIRDIARSRSSASEYFSNLVVFRLAASPFAWIVAMAAGLILGYTSTLLWSLAWAGVYALSMQAMNYVRAYYRAYENLRLEGLSTIAEKLLVVGFGTVGLLWTRSPSGTLAAMALGLAIAVALNVVWIATNLARFEWHLVRSDFIRGAVQRALPLFLYSFAIVVYLRLGGVLLEYWHGEQAAGEFGAAFRIVEALFLLPAVFSAAILPRLSALYHDGRLLEFRHVFSRSFLVVTGLAVAIAACVSWLSPNLMELANPREPQAVPASILSTLVWAFPLMAAKDLLIVSLVASDRHRFLAWCLGSAASLSVALHLALTRPVGSMGLVAVFFTVETLIVILCGILLWRTTSRTVAAVNIPSTEHVKHEPQSS